MSEKVDFDCKADLERDILDHFQLTKMESCRTHGYSIEEDDFNDWIDGYNEYILKAYNEASKEKQGAEFDEVVEEFVDVETA